MSWGNVKTDKAKNVLIKRIKSKISSGVRIEFKYRFIKPEATSIHFTDEINRSTRKLYTFSNEYYNLSKYIDMDNITSDDTYVHSYRIDIVIPFNETECITLHQNNDYGKSELVPIVWKNGFWDYVMNNKYLSRLFINEDDKSKLIIKNNIVSNSDFRYWSNNNYLDFNLSCEDFNEIYELIQDEHGRQDNLKHNKFLEMKKEEEKEKDNMLNKIINKK